MVDREIQLKIVFTNYELDFMTQYLTSHVQKIKRHNPHLTFETPSLRKNLPLLQFNPHLNPKILAFDLFVLQVELIQSFKPQPRVFYTGVLQDLTKLFPNSYLLTEDFQPSNVPTPLIPLKTRDGSICLPSLIQSEDSQPVVLESFNLHLSLEHFQFSPTPYKIWEPVQTFQGNMIFPLVGSTNHSMPSVTHPLPDRSYPSRLHVTFNQPLSRYQHHPLPTHRHPSATR